MDLFTVLLHEYGHALGLEHSPDAHDLMATTLQPGVRRTLSADEQLMLMDLAGVFVTPDSPSEPYRPTDPGVPLPFNQNGSWEELNVVNGDAVRSALFGGGTQATSLIQHVFVGDAPKRSTPTAPADHNSFPQIRNVVAALGIPVGPSNDHEHHFHVDFRTPTRVPITQHLQEDTSGSSQADVSGLSANDVASFFEQAQVELNIEQGDAIVFTLDMPDVPQNYANVVIAKTNQAQKSPEIKERAIGFCFAVNYDPTGEQNSFSKLGPNADAATYFSLYEKRTVQEPLFSDVEMIAPPKHGKLVEATNEYGSRGYDYVPDRAYVGDDKAVFRVHVDGKAVKVVYFIKVSKVAVDNVSHDIFCKKTGTQWKISSASDFTSIVSNLSSIASLAGNFALSVKVDVTPLEGSALAQTTGTNITLDTTAAGHGWFIDATPSDHSEFLPSSNPNLMFTLDPATGTNTKPVKVHQNDYPNMRVVLEDLGLNPKAGRDHETHFHIYLKPPTPKGVTKNLSAKEVNPFAVSIGSVTFTRALVDYAETLVSGETLMMTVDVPFAPPESPPAILAQAAANSKAPRVDFILKTCDETEHTPNNPRSAFRGVDPAYGLKNYLELPESILKDIDIKLLQGTQHGELKEETDNLGLISYRYDPNPGYLGDDQAVFVAEYGGKVFKIIYTIKVLEGVSDRHPVCPDAVMIKAPRPRSRGADATSVTEGGSENLNLGVDFAELSDGTLGQNNANGITLDVTAAGHGWFIDATPSDHSEFLPSSNPNEWIAKQGSEADGKMDLFTVLLHEYGHALGLEHSPDAHDLMATTLQPGVRRTLSADEQLMLMDLAGVFVTPDSPSEPYRPTDPGVPLPFTRINGTATYSRIRRGDGFAATGLTGESAVPQYDIAANAKLENSQFVPSADSGLAAGWSTTGDVRFADGSATLNETATTQTRLNQVFVLGQNDRYLSFSVANAALGDQANSPDDAFEVALIDANT